MRPLEPRILPADVEIGPVTLMLFAAYGGACAMCESPIVGPTNVIDMRTGQRAPERFDRDRWPHLLLLCHGCFDAHQSQLLPYVPSTLLWPFDRYAAGVEPAAELTYNVRDVTLELEDSMGALESQPIRAVIAAGYTERARATIDHFGLNGPFFIGPTTFRVPYGDPRQTRDGRMRARLNAWQAGEWVASRISGVGESSLSKARLDGFRELLNAAGCWSSCMTAIWRAHPSLPLLRRLFDNTHPGVFEIVIEGVRSVRMAGASGGNEWAGTRRSWFDDLDAALAARR